MHPLLLLDELSQFLKQIVKDFYLDTDKKQPKEPQIVKGYLPPKKSTLTPDFPYIICRLTDGEDTQAEGKVNVKILVGTYSEDNDGWMYAVNVMMRIRSKLLITRTLANKYRMEYPFKWKLFEEQAYPEWIGEILTTWTIAIPIEEFKEDDIEYED